MSGILSVKDQVSDLGCIRQVFDLSMVCLPLTNLVEGVGGEVFSSSLARKFSNIMFPVVP